jgi:hypothetical protein
MVSWSAAGAGGKPYVSDGRPFIIRTHRLTIPSAGLYEL